VRAVPNPGDGAILGVRSYREFFQTEAGKYVLADLRQYCRARPEDLELEAIASEEKLDRDAFLEHVAMVRVYRRIVRLSEMTDKELDEYERNLRERFGGGDDE